MRSRHPAAGILAAIALFTVACGSADDWSQPHSPSGPVGTLGPGFVTTSPTPEATITPRPGSWTGIHPSPGYRVVLLTTGNDPQTNTLVTAVTQWAEQENASLRTVTATGPGQLIPSITQAIALKPDLVVSAGNSLVDPLTVVTASHLGQQFLVIGAELAEPTANVTAANWAGASFRGEGLGTSSSYDPASFTPERSAAAVRAGVASVLTGLTGIVIRLA